MSKKFSELDRASSLNNGDLFALAQVDAEAETGYKSVSSPVSDVAQKLLKNTLYPTDLNTEHKNIFGAINENRADLNDINTILDGFSIINFIEDKNINSSGEIIDAEGFCVSEKIPYTWTGYRRYYCDAADTSGSQCRIAFYDSNDVLLNSFGAPSNLDANLGRFRAINAETQVTGTVSYVRFSFVKTYIGKVTENASINPTIYWSATSIIQPGIVSEVEKMVPIAEQSNSVLGSNSLTAEASSLSSNTTLVLLDAPWFIKKNVGISARMNFSSFTNISVGKGYQKYRGKWVVIDGTNITPYSSDGSTDTAGTPIPHGLTISDFLQLSMYMGQDGKMTLSVNSMSGTFSTIIDYGYEWNYEPFIFGSQNMTNVKISFSCFDIRIPLWVFGDSYMGISNVRIGGQLRNLGFFNYCINSIAGARAVDSGTPGKSSYNDLLRMLAIATPKFLLWTDGMNGGDQSNIDFLPILISLCEQKGIELILYLPPSVPTINHDLLNTYIKSTGLRYVDGNAAVGATSEGVWYTDYLSSDGVHPTDIGAQALAARFITDCPELMQYGNT